jgi:hypothetical protein
VRGAEVERDHAGERELLPGAAGEGEVVLQGHVALGPDEVMRELAAGAGQLQDLLVRLDDVELRPGHARGQAEQAGLLGDVVGAGGREVGGCEGGEPGGGDVGRELGEAHGVAEGGGVEGDPVQDGRVLEEQGHEVRGGQAAPEAGPGGELGLGEPHGPAPGDLVPGEGAQERGSPGAGRPLGTGERGEVQVGHQQALRRRQTGFEAAVVSSIPQKGVLGTRATYRGVAMSTRAEGYSCPKIEPVGSGQVADFALGRLARRFSA